MANSLILTIETSTPACSVALHQNGKEIATCNMYGEKSHSKQITILIDHIVKQSGFHLSDLDAIAVGKGPGSYTGLRIGVSTAKGLCFALDKPLIAVNTLEAMALQLSYHQIVDEKSWLCPMLDARRMEVYCATFNQNLDIILPTQAVIIDEKSFSDLLIENKIVFFGDGAEKCRKMLSYQPNANFIVDIHPSAKYTGMIAAKYMEEKKFENLAYFEPFYLKDFVTNVGKSLNN